MTRTLGFIGAGQMAQALARGMVAGGVAAADGIVASDPSEAAREAFCSQVPGCRCLPDNQQVARAADTVILAVKPQYLDAAARSLAGGLGSETLVVSILAGIPLERLAAALGTERVIRVMPNTPCLIGRGASAYARGAAATDADAEHVQHLLSTVGVAVELEERLLDAVTGLSGSGPAFVALFTEALIDGGVRAGLPRAIATTLAAQTVWGVGEMLARTGTHPAELKDRVTSPAGTTIAGVQQLERAAFRGAVIDAVDAAARRAKELGS